MPLATSGAVTFWLEFWLYRTAYIPHPATPTTGTAWRDALAAQRSRAQHHRQAIARHGTAALAMAEAHMLYPILQAGLDLPTAATEETARTALLNLRAQAIDMIPVWLAAA